MKKLGNSVSGVAFLNKIDEILAEQNKTRKSLCETLGILQGTMATWKTKDIMPSIDTIKSIAEELNVSVDWLISDSKHFEEQEHFFRQYSRHSIRLRIYDALKKKYEKDDNRFTSNFLNNESLLRELHYYYFNGGYVSYDVLYNWSKGRCEINTYFFDQWAQSLNTTLQFILTGSEVLIPSNDNYSKPFEEDLYNLALEYRNELYCLDNLTDERKKSGITIINQLMRLEHLEYVEKKKAENNE
mgnify:CR=1 FL=1